MFQNSFIVVCKNLAFSVLAVYVSQKFEYKAESLDTCRHVRNKPGNEKL